MPDTVVDGRYKVLSRLGSGGMADVFCAQDEQLGRKVALKLLHRRFAEDDEFVERFRREASSAAGLSHQNVVGVYDRGEWDGTYYIAMEYLPGRTLKQLIREEAPVQPLRAIDITRQILRAARFAHRHGVIHRDLKPHNVMIDGEDRVKVTDFGIARAGASDMTETGSILGTAQYISPEQAQGHAVSAQADLYSVGVILYELLTGRLPFDSDAAVTIALKHVSEAPAPPRSLNAAVPPELERIVLWALEKDPARRPSSADAFIAALDEVREQVVAGSVPGERTTAFMPVPAPVPVPVPVPAEDAEAAVVPAPVDGDGVPPDEEPPLEEPPPEGRGVPWPWLAALLVLLLAGAGVATYLLTRPEKVDVPRVVGQKLDVAQALLENDGFTVNVIRRTSDQPQDEVIKQDPLEGERVDKGATVSVTVSDGPGQGVVPNVEGLPKAKALRRLRRAGFETTEETEHSNTVAVGNVVETSPGVGEQLEKGQTVTVYVSSGPAPVAVPDVVGEDSGSADADLRNAGFKVAQTTLESSTKSPGTVLSQNPAGGTSVSAGTTVTIVVATESLVSIPSVTGKSADEAVNAISDAGFQPVIRPKKTQKIQEDGVVIAQSPGGGTRAKKGTTVTLTVGNFAPDVDPNEQPTTTTDEGGAPPSNTDTTATAPPGGSG
jgi:beta-lactam-binding protein with PASTA domain/predicted Ser/Thr protein kinase